MLPTTIVERLVMASGLRFGVNLDERRRHARYPLRATAQLFTVQQRTLDDSLRVTIRDISVAGVGVVVPSTLKLTAEWVLKIEPRKGAAATILLCRTVRVCSMSASHSIVGGTIVALLAPGQLPTAGRVLPDFEWLSTLDATPEDPFASQTWN